MKGSIRHCQWLTVYRRCSQIQALGGVTSATYCTTVATREGESIVQQGLPVGLPADVSQVADRMTSGEPCAEITRPMGRARGRL
jgi:hypothetical protein